MQQLIDCTMLGTQAVRIWAQRWVTEMSDHKLRIRMADASDALDTKKITALFETAHLCLLPVCPDNLSWARTWLGQMNGVLPVPVIAVVHGLKTAALRDLITLGVADFIRDPGCPDELRVRVERVLAQMRKAQMDRLSVSLGSSPEPVQTVVAQRRCHRGYGDSDDTSSDAADDDISSEKGVMDVAGPAQEQGSRSKTVHTYAMGRLVSRAPHRAAEMPRVPYRAAHPARPADAALRRNLAPANGLELEAFAAATAARCALHDEPFKQAKGRVVDGFEKAYLTTTLGRYGGNIAQAAKAAKKHRRAFWELIRKHRIDLSLYRARGQTQTDPDT